jgi:hypothetical protein
VNYLIKKCQAYFVCVIFTTLEHDLEIFIVRVRVSFSKVHVGIR